MPLRLVVPYSIGGLLICIAEEIVYNPNYYVHRQTYYDPWANAPAY